MAQLRKDLWPESLLDWKDNQQLRLHCNAAIGD